MTDSGIPLFAPAQSFHFDVTLGYCYAMIWVRTPWPTYPLLLENYEPQAQNTNHMLVTSSNGAHLEWTSALSSELGSHDPIFGEYEAKIPGK